jgi:hypothetical protein
MQGITARFLAAIPVTTLLLGLAAAPSAHAVCYAVYDSGYRSHMARAGMSIPAKVAAPGSVTTPAQCRAWLSQKISGYGYDAGLQKTQCSCDGSGSSGGYSGGYSGGSTKDMVRMEMAGAVGNMLGQMIAAALAPPPAPRGPSPEEIARKEQERLEAERLAKLRQEQKDQWNAANNKIASAADIAREKEAGRGTELLGKMEGLGSGQGMQAGALSSSLSLADMTPVGSGRYDTSRMTSWQRLLCASTFSKEAAAAGGGRTGAEKSRHLNEQADKVMSGAPTDRECPLAGGPAVPDVPDPTPVDAEQYAKMMRETREDIDSLQGFREEKEKTSEKKKEVETKLAKTREKAQEVIGAPAAAKPEPGKDQNTLLQELKALESDLAAELSSLDKKDRELSASIETVSGRLEKRQQALLADAGPISPAGRQK